MFGSLFVQVIFTHSCTGLGHKILNFNPCAKTRINELKNWKTKWNFRLFFTILMNHGRWGYWWHCKVRTEEIKRRTNPTFPLVQRPLIEISPMARTRAQAHIWPSSTYKPRARWKNITYTLSPQNYPRADRFCNKKVLGEPPRSIEQFLA